MRVNESEMEEDKDGNSFQVTDRRSWLEDGDLIDRSPVPEKRYPSFVEELKARTELAEQKLKERIKEVEAENEAFRDRLGKDMERRLEQQKMDLLRGFLEVIDNFERALQAFEQTSSLEELEKGIQLNLELFLHKLKAAGVEPLDVLEQPFDPHQSEAVGVIPVEDPDLDDHVVEVVQQGYRFGDQLLRPAHTRVGKYQASGDTQ